jgi:peptidyl-prolyl cis-trans isomerase A (cyclophilin A)
MQQLLSLPIGAACLLLAAGCTGQQENRDVSKSETPRVRTASTEATGTAGDDQTTEKPFKVKFVTSKGDFVVRVIPEWAPQGAARFRGLVESRFYDGCRFFRVLPNFMVQFGINGDPKVQEIWRDRPLPDDRLTQSNTESRITFATSGPNSRTTQVFISYKDNSFLDSQGFTPFGEVVEGWAVVKDINSKHGEEPNQGQIQSQGNEYLKRAYPDLDYIETARIIE